MASSELLYVKIMNFLRFIIEQNQNDPQFILPSEKQLALRFSCSRIPAKRALNELKSEGLIYRIQGKGSLITQRNTLAQGVKKSVVLLVPNIRSRFTVDIVESVQKYFRDAGINLFLSVTEDITQIEEQMIDSAISKQFDGLIIFPVINENFNKTLINLILKKYPIVFVGRNIPGLHTSCVSCDHYIQTLNAMDFLYKKGHREIGFITENAESANCYTERIRAYTGFMEKHCKKPPRLCEIDFFTGRDTPELRPRINEAVCEFLGNNPQISALLTTNQAETEVCRFVRDRQDLQILLFDQPESNNPAEMEKWMVIDQEPARLGSLAAEQIADQIINHAPLKQLVVESKIRRPKFEA